MGVINTIINNPIILVTIIISNLVITLITLMVTAICVNKYKKLNNKYKKFMNKLGQGEKIEEIMSEYIESVKKLEGKTEEIDKEIERLENNLKKCVQKVGLVRYNAFNDTGSDLSFTLALMDSDNTGIVVNGLYSRESSSIFAKPLIKGDTKYNLSAEEIQAIDIAKASSVARY